MFRHRQRCENRKADRLVLEAPLLSEICKAATAKETLLLKSASDSHGPQTEEENKLQLRRKPKSDASFCLFDLPHFTADLELRV